MGTRTPRGVQDREITLGEAGRNNPRVAVELLKEIF